MQPWGKAEREDGAGSWIDKGNSEIERASTEGGKDLDSVFFTDQRSPSSLGL